MAAYASPGNRGRQIADVHLYDTVAQKAFDVGTSASGFPDMTGGLVYVYGDNDNEATVYVGDSAVTVGDGFPIPASGANNYSPFRLSNLNVLYGIAPIVDQKIRVLVTRETD